MFAKWLDEYEKNLGNTRFISQLAAFLIAIFAFLGCGRIIEVLFYNPSVLNHNWNDFLISIIFHLIVGILFSVRFILLLFRSKKIFWFSQSIWFICVSAILGFYIATRFVIYGSFYPPESSVSFGMDNYPILFLYAQYTFEALMGFYLLSSPVRQIITAVYSLIKIRKNK